MFARNCPKLPKPTMPIFRDCAGEVEEDEEEEDMIQRIKRRGVGGVRCLSNKEAVLN